MSDSTQQLRNLQHTCARLSLVRNRIIEISQQITRENIKSHLCMRRNQKNQQVQQLRQKQREDIRIAKQRQQQQQHS